VTRILVLGGYGGFGARIARRLASEDYEVIVAGRHLDKARRFCADHPNLLPTALDRDRDLAGALIAYRPFAVVDAAGPFQGLDYDVPRACIAAGCHYLDIADARDFVADIGVLDGEARQTGVAIVSGASSVPALSGAVVRALARGMDEIRAVEIAISASNRATAGPSVTKAILSYLGRPIRIWRGRRWATDYGWQNMRRENFCLGDGKPLARRLVAIAEVPDLALLPRRLPGAPAVTFRAGTELAIQNRALWLLSWLLRSNWIGTLAPLIPLLLGLQRLTARLGSDRSGMIVRLFGLDHGRRLERRWTLIADNGSGPEIPGLAVPLLLRQLVDGSLAAGAQDAGSLLSLDALDADFAALSIRHDTIEIAQAPALYARVMGARFDTLAPRVRAMHDVLRDHGARGKAVVTPGRNPLARLVAALVGFPSAGEHDLHVAFSEVDGVETWTRQFSGRRFHSRLAQQGDALVERFGLLRFGFDLASDGQSLTMHLKRWWLGPFRLPLALAPRSTAREWQADDRFQFDVPIALPVIGLLVHYRGWLEPIPPDPT
jgi:uncharacterized protein DUF4166/saccharopine dehydrogenase-like protein